MSATQNLESAIQQLIELGEVNPTEIARKLIDRNGIDWLLAEFPAYAAEFVAEIARHRLGSIRRSAEVALRPGDQMASAEMKVAKMWVPGCGWKRVADLTADDLEARARMYDRLAGASLVRARWLRDVIDLMSGEAVKALGRLKAALPPLPDDDDDLRELVAA